MTDQMQDPLEASPIPIRWKAPLWVSIVVCVAAWWFFGWFILAASEVGYEPKDIPDIIEGGVGLVVLVASIELIRAIRRRLWKEPDIWIDPVAPGRGRTWALTAALTAIFKLGGFYLLGGASRAGSVNDVFSFEAGAPFWAAFIVWIWFTPKPEPRGVSFYSLFCVGLLAAAAVFVVQILLYPTQMPGFLVSIDSMGTFVQALIFGRRPSGT